MKSHNSGRRARANRAMKVIEHRMEQALDSRRGKQPIKKVIPQDKQPAVALGAESKPESPVGGPVRENPFARIVRKLNEENARQQK